MTPASANKTTKPERFDIVILSFAKDADLRAVTEHCLDTLVASEDPEVIHFRIFVLESNHAAPPYSQVGVETIYPAAPFNYHAYMNKGIACGAAPLVAICNNDLEFKAGWASALLAAFASDATLQSASPFCAIHHPGYGFGQNTGNYYGYRVLREIAGWCLVFRREMLKVTGPLDERFYFWYADDDYARTLQEHKLKHALVTDSVVNHLDSRTLQTHTSAKQWMMTKRARYLYEEKWENKGSFYFFRKKLKLYVKFPLYCLGVKKLRKYDT